VRIKVRRLGLEVVDRRKKFKCSTTTAELVLPEELFSVEEILKELHAAVLGLKVSGLDKTEVVRLRGIIAGCKVYKEMLVDYMDYRGIAVELMEWRVKYEALSKPAGVSTKPVA
jgi:hypothetical protein